MMATQKENKVYQVFQSISGNYDHMNSVISFRLHKRWRKKTMKQMNVHRGAKTLDLCCGTADWTIQLGKAVGKGGSATGIDFSEKMLEVGREKVHREQLANIDLIHGNVNSLPFPDDSFDYVTIGFGLRNVSDYLRVLKEMQRVLKPGGTAVCLETSWPENSLVEKFYSFYFQSVMPVIGKVLINRYDEYRWLQESTMAFPSKETLGVMFMEAGFSRVQMSPFSAGTVCAHIARKK
jgi:demethylmenaquinone methyltransferase/2-methoxy-6-polyprenyl-1,4-benzoquinol methylase